MLLNVIPRILGRLTQKRFHSHGRDGHAERRDSNELAKGRNSDGVVARGGGERARSGSGGEHVRKARSGSGDGNGTRQKDVESPRRSSMPRKLFDLLTFNSTSSSSVARGSPDSVRRLSSHGGAVTHDAGVASNEKIQNTPPAPPMKKFPRSPPHEYSGNDSSTCMSIGKDRVASTNVGSEGRLAVDEGRALPDTSPPSEDASRPKSAPPPQPSATPPQSTSPSPLAASAPPTVTDTGLTAVVPVAVAVEQCRDARDITTDARDGTTCPPTLAEGAQHNEPAVTSEPNKLDLLRATIHASSARRSDSVGRVDDDDTSQKVELKDLDADAIVSMEQVLGEGSCGVVSLGRTKGHAVGLDDFVALKKCKDCKHQDQMTKAFWLEANIVSSLEVHANVIQLFGVWTSGAVPYLVYELCNVDLGTLLQTVEYGNAEEKLAPYVVVDWSLQIAVRRHDVCCDHATPILFVSSSGRLSRVHCSGYPRGSCLCEGLFGSGCSIEVSVFLRLLFACQRCSNRNQL